MNEVKGTVTVETLSGLLAPVFRQQLVRKAILFGSYARGDADEYSDLDLVIVAESQRPFLERFKDYAEIWRTCPVKAIDLLVYTPTEFQQMVEEGNPLIEQVLKEGKVIYEAGPAKRG